TCKGNAHVECAAFALNAAYPGIATMPLSNAADNKQAQATAFDFFVFLSRDAHMPLEKMLLILRADSIATVGDADNDLLIALLDPHIDRATIGRVFNGIINQVGD